MPIFMLIRHGETDYNRKMRIAGRLPGVHLNKKGRQQAQMIADRLSSLPIKAIYASPLERTLETAAPLAEALKLTVISTPALLETDCGEWQGNSIRKLRRLKVWRTLQQSASLFRFPGGETVYACQHRLVEALDSFRQTHEPQDLVACFSHSDPIKMLVSYYLGMPLDYFQRLSINTGSISVLQVGENACHLLMLNYNPQFSFDFTPPTPHKKSPVKGAPSPA